jgi:hypothetical protein
MNGKCATEHGIADEEVMTQSTDAVSKEFVEDAPGYAEARMC